MYSGKRRRWTAIGQARGRLSDRWVNGLHAGAQSILRAASKHSRAVAAVMWLSGLMAAIVLIPGILVNRQDASDSAAAPAPLPPIAIGGGEAAATEEAQERPIAFPIYLTAENRIASVTLEQYVRGVVAAEMPIEFELEALKAQAIAARTYIVRRFVTKDISNVPVEGAWVTDSVQHQAYLTDEEIAQKWDESVRAANVQKLTKAVEETRGQILTYEGTPILAAFFSTSNGYTENSEDYWSDELPYLRSVESPWETELSPKYKLTSTMTANTFAKKLGINQKKAASIRVLETSPGNRIKRIQIGGKTFTGREVREKLGLSSTQFDIHIQGGEVAITTYGNGHGVGMSQWGAQGMALRGYRAEEILKHYYSGVSIEGFRGPEAYL